MQEVDKKKKKKKGTLGVGNGAVFFASETDKVRPSLSLFFLPSPFSFLAAPDLLELTSRAAPRREL